MSTNINNKTINNEFFIRLEDFQDTFKVLKDSIRSEFSLGDWIDGNAVLDSDNLNELMVAMRWTPEFDSYGNIKSLHHNGINIADEELLFKSISSFVRAGSFIEYEREGYYSDFKIRFEFNNKLVNRLVWNKIYNEITSVDEFVFNEDVSGIL